MLVELRVQNLGVIDDLALQFGSGMTALTGETGAGKTLVVEALELLMGGRADPALVRAGTECAIVEGRFLAEGNELVLLREVPADGRSRAYLDGRMATAGALSEIGTGLVDLHGQHAHQSLLHQSAQRAALDRYAGVTTEDVERCHAAVRALDERLADLGGDERALARELDLLSFQLHELEAAALTDPDEDAILQEEEGVLSSAQALREAVAAARDVLGEDDGARDLIGRASAALSHHDPLADLGERLGTVAAEVDDVLGELRDRSERFFDDPERLAAVQERRRLLSELRRKYGATLEAVLEFREEVRVRLEDLEAGEGRRGELAAQREQAIVRLREAEQTLGDARRAAAPKLGEEIETRLRVLALPRARLEVTVPNHGRGDAVEFRFGANAGEASLPLARVASGGELARAMLATRLVLTGAPSTLVFDEVDAGIGGEAALYVGRALAELGERYQVLVVTHLAQVAAFATEQIAIEKRESADRTVTTARPVSGDERLAELSRMLSGQPSSMTARRHAEELLEVAAGNSAGAPFTSGTLAERTPWRTV
ncbi:MAG: DNA repair protein RecN [Acidimicrobiales bacterium]